MARASGDCPSTPTSTRARAVDLSSTPPAPLAALALVAADHAAHVLAPRILDLAGRRGAARRMTQLPPITSVLEARKGSEVFARSIDEGAALEAWQRWRSDDWREELGSTNGSRPAQSDPTKLQLLELALSTLNHALRLEPEAPYLDYAPPPVEEQLTRAILSTIDALEIATSANLEKDEAEKLAMETFMLLVATTVPRSRPR
jgi:hypothetical protein